jgi:hypothetical protein
MLKIAIPKPCHEDWDKMETNQQGRYCNACAKTVTDFTAMSDEAIKDFFINKKDEKVCGRFKNEQLSRIVIDLPANILYIDMPLWKKFLAACLIVFSASLFSCDTTVDGKRPIVEREKIDSIPKKLLNQSGGMVGGLLVEWKYEKCNAITIPSDSNLTYGYSVMVPAGSLHLVGDTTVIIPDTIPLIQTTNLPDSNMILKPDSSKTKNPAKLDSVNCDQSIFTKL